MHENEHTKQFQVIPSVEQHPIQHQLVSQ